MIENTWDRLLGKIEPKVGAHSYSTWFKPTCFLGEDQTSVKVQVPNSWFAEWIESNYQGVIRDALAELERPGLIVRFLPEGNGKAPEPAPVTTADPLGEDIGNGWLNTRYTFDSFVVSSCNQFAHAAARAVAEQPASSYNPLFIYGGVGLGKTHLMQAIGSQIRQRRGARMRYISAENFMNGLINAIRFERTLEFKNRYRNVDLLLIDDVQFLAGKERTQEEFFHTFNALHDSQRQIVMTSDCPPREIPLLEERLRSRFEWGLIADIQPPDLETKVAILRKKAEAEGCALPDDVALFIATNSKSNIRELEGALIRVIAYSSMSGQEISLSLAKATLGELMEADKTVVTVESVQKLVADYYSLKVSELKSRNNSQRVAFPRQVAMYLCKQLTHFSLPEIGRRFGGKHHSTVIHAVKKIEARRGKEKEFDRLVEGFSQSFS